jgi:hypothetical protein
MSNFDKMVQARVDKTGESWSTAAGQVRASSRTGAKDDAATIVSASSAFVFDGTSGPPDGDGVFAGDSPALGVFPRNYVTHYVFVDLDEGRRRLGMALSDPPVTGGFVIDKFDYPPTATPAELLAEAERRNGPLRIQYANGELGESFPGTASGVDEAHMLCSALAHRGREIRLVTSRGVLLKHWNPTSPKTFTSIEVGVDGAPGPRHFDGECPKCNAPVSGVIPLDKASIEFACNACGRKFVATRTDPT